MKIETRPLTTSQSQRPCDSTFFLESHACLCFGKLVVNGRRGRATASFIAPSAQFLHFSPKGRREMVFGRSQRQETGFVIAGYVLAKEQRGLTSDYKRFPLPSSPAKGRRRCCLGPKPETRKRKSPENHSRTSSGIQKSHCLRPWWATDNGFL